MDTRKEAPQHSALAYSGAAGLLPFVYMRASDVAAAAAISKPTLYRKIAAGELPQGELLGPGTRRWRSDVIAAWFEKISAAAASNRDGADEHIQQRARISVAAKRKKAAERAALAAGGAQ